MHHRRIARKLSKLRAKDRVEGAAGPCRSLADDPEARAAALASLAANPAPTLCYQCGRRPRMHGFIYCPSCINDLQDRSSPNYDPPF
jgi:hypothetical protein